MELQGKVALITGASAGIGAAAAKALADQGVHVALAARSTPKIEALAASINAGGGEAIAVPCDVASYNAVSSAVERCLITWGSLDILVNNAATIDPIARIENSDPEEWSKVVDVNLKGVYYGIRAAAPAMLEKQSGCIINISSGAATGALEGWSHYCATKAGVLSLTRCADKEFHAMGIRVVGLSPGTVATDMQVSIKASGINPVSQLDPSVHIPPQWVGQAIAWLCTDDAADLHGLDFSLKDDEGRRRVGLI